MSNNKKRKIFKVNPIFISARDIRGWGSTNLEAMRKNKKVKMTRRYLHPANGCHRRNAGVDEQILLYPVTIYSYPVLFAIPEPEVGREVDSVVFWTFK